MEELELISTTTFPPKGLELQEGFAHWARKGCGKVSAQHGLHPRSLGGFC